MAALLRAERDRYAMEVGSVYYQSGGRKDASQESGFWDDEGRAAYISRCEIEINCARATRRVTAARATL